MAPAIALKVRDEHGLALAGQLLFYPVLDYRCVTPSMYKNADAPVWTGKNCRDMWRQYLNLTPAEMSATQVSYYASPAMASDLTGLPATYISRCEFDPLCDEAEVFAKRLSDAGIQVESVFHASTVHGFDLLLPIALSRQAIAMGVAAARSFIDIDT
ncbi:alpha/beta hydrolase fold domain-containing protein [Simiduia curdlanivorans]|uniref:Alpha/beta hydrolase fold domain-containing protein n=1 Tax=Simiduia curdlanivorans TaxID=1492769 RepID=A0ABV8V774_9GAMM|nr:alpha/beta hydrolase fold domain-containing protein [Simiduia curdlanivorans]MDN3638684.1 alpha/beta hydrolase fold domain-containing protein [Simiduia curdlanivorans]